MRGMVRPGTDIDARLRGVPFERPTPIEEMVGGAYAPHLGAMSLPALTLDEAVFVQNVELFFRYLNAQGVAVAPHAKTPMSPDIVGELRRSGAWGASVANLQQAAVMMQAGEPRLLLANEIGGKAAGQRLGRLLAAHPGTELFAFADSPEAVSSLVAAAGTGGREFLPVLVEVGAGRAGARDADAVEATIEAVIAAGSALRLAGVATYEGAVATADATATRAAIDELMKRTVEAFATVREAAPRTALICSAGGSAYFDLIVDALAPVASADGNATLLLRSGAIFFSDHGIYARSFAALDARGGLRIGGETVSAADGFKPALRLWAEVLSRPEHALAIAGFGMRDVSFDQGLPVVLAAYRDGLDLALPEGGVVVEKLNDQHAFLRLGESSDIRVGDILCLGISHPCTCLDHWRAVFGLGPDGTVTRVLRTHFG